MLLAAVLLLQVITRLLLLLLRLAWSKVGNSEAWFCFCWSQDCRGGVDSPFKILCYCSYSRGMCVSHLWPLWQTEQIRWHCENKLRLSFLVFFFFSKRFLLWCVFSWIVRNLYLSFNMSLFLAVLKYFNEVRAVRFPHHLFTKASNLQKVLLTHFFQLK